MDDRPAEKVQKLRFWFGVFVVVAIVALLLSFAFEAWIGVLTLVAIVLAFLLHTELLKAEGKNVVNANRNSRAIMILGGLVLFLVLLSVVLSILT